jgi:small subunit ribosomal protein S4
MARYTGPVCKLCRREGEKLFLKGTKCYTEKCPIDRRSYAPGEHGNRRVRMIGYNLQLREKQKLRRIYGVLEGQFRNYFKKAVRKKTVTGDVLMQLLESRLDNLLYRMGFAISRAQARQLILHQHVLVNSRRVTVPSYQVKAGDEIGIAPKSQKLDAIHSSLQKRRDVAKYDWLDVDKANLKGTFLEIPERGKIPVNVREQLVVELYSK